MIRRATTGKHGGDRKSEDATIKTDNISLDKSHGTRKDYTLDRLDRERPGPFYRL